MLNAFFDLETLSLNPYVDGAKIILAQIKHGDNVELIKEWEFGEKRLILRLAKVFSEFPKYTPVFTYNGGFDFNYLMGRVNKVFEHSSNIEKYHNVFIRNIKHCDLLQFDGGYFVSFYKLCNKYGMPMQSRYDGKNMGTLYESKQYDYILEHGLEDIMMLEKIITETDLSDRFLKTEILTWDERKFKR